MLVHVLIVYISDSANWNFNNGIYNLYKYMFSIFVSFVDVHLKFAIGLFSLRAIRGLINGLHSKKRYK